MTYMSGDDHLALAQVLMGASGVVSVTSNAAPARMSEMIQRGLQGEVRRALEIHDGLFPLFRALFTETNPAPVKKALELMGVIESDSLREPLVQVQPSTANLLSRVLSELELL